MFERVTHEVDAIFSFERVFAKVLRLKVETLAGAVNIWLATGSIYEGLLMYHNPTACLGLFLVMVMAQVVMQSISNLKVTVINPINRSGKILFFN